MASGLLVATLGLIFTSSALNALPSYIHVCKRNDPQFNKCIMKSVEAIKPKLIQGIPELEVPPLEPLELKDLKVYNGDRLLKITGTDFVLHGASNFILKEIKADLPNNSFKITVTFPKLTLDATYEVNGKFLNLNLHGKGPIEAEGTDIDGVGILKGKRVMKAGKEYFILDAIDLKLDMKDLDVKLAKGFFKDPKLTDALNVAIRENKREILPVMVSRTTDTVKDVILEIANQIVKNFTYDELFPEK